MNVRPLGRSIIVQPLPLEYQPLEHVTGTACGRVFLVGGSVRDVKKGDLVYYSDSLCGSFEHEYVIYKLLDHYQLQMKKEGADESGE